MSKVEKTLEGFYIVWDGAAWWNNPWGKYKDCRVRL